MLWNEEFETYNVSHTGLYYIYTSVITRKEPCHEHQVSVYIMILV